MDRKTKATIAGCLNIAGIVGLLVTAIVAFDETPGYSVMILLFGTCLFYGTLFTTALKYEAAKEQGESEAVDSKDET